MDFTNEDYSDVCDSQECASQEYDSHECDPQEYVSHECDSQERDSQECDSHECDSPQPKRRPAPIVSLGKIIGYRLACIGVTLKAMDLFNSDTLQKLMDKVEGSTLPKQTKKSNETKPKRSVSFNEYVHEILLLDNQHRDREERQDTNVNASQGKGSETSTSGVQRVAKTRQSNTSSKQTSPSPNTRSCLKAASKGKAKGNSFRKPKNPKLKTKTESKNDLTSIRDQPSVIRTRSTSALSNDCNPVATPELPSKKSSETMFVSLAEKHKKKKLHRRMLELLTGDGGKTSDEKTQIKTGKTSRKTRHFDPPTRRKTHKSDQEKSHESPPSSSSRKGLQVKHSLKSKPSYTVTHKSPTKIGNKTMSCKRRWADVVAGTSKITDGLIQVQNSNSPEELSVTEKGKPTQIENSTADQSTPLEKDGSAFSIATRRSSRTRSMENTSIAESSQELKSIDQENSHTSEKHEDNEYQVDFPTLDELKGKNQKREKWCQRQKEENHDGANKTTIKKRKVIRREEGKHGRLGKSHRANRSKRERRAKIRNNHIETRSKAGGEHSQPLASANDGTANSPPNTVDNMPNVLTQPVRSKRVHDKKGGTVHGSRNEKSPNVFKVSPSRDNTKNDICSKLDAMSVNGNVECPGSSNPDSKGMTKERSLKEDKSPRSRVRKDTSKSKLDEPGPSQKKTSSRYRALLRRDRGKVDAKKATEIFNCGRWVDLHQREKIYDRFDVHQQRRNRRRMDNNDPVDRVSQLLTTLNTLYYCLPPTNDDNTCPIM